MLKKYITFLCFVLGISLSFSQNYNMSNLPVSTCSGTFYDSAAAGNYTNSETFTKTFCSSTPGSAIRFVFTQFSLENNADFLFVYDGNTTSAPLLGTYTGTDLPQVIQPTGSNTSGCITFLFTSDGTGVSSGWVADISCITPCQTITTR